MNDNINYNTTTADTTSLRQAKIARDVAFHNYRAYQDNKSSDADVAMQQIPLILDELAECIATIPNTFSNNENVLALQLSDCIDEFSATLSSHECNIFIKRYFFLYSMSDIASCYKISEDKVIDILKDCRYKFKLHLSSKGYICNRETLFEGFTNISDKLLNDRTDTATTSVKVKSKTIAIACIFSLVACFILVLVLALRPWDTSKSTDSSDNTNMESLPLNVLAEKEFLDDGNYVNTTKLTEYVPEYPNTTSSLTTFINIYGYTLVYKQYELKNNDILKYISSVDIPLNEVYAPYFSESVLTGNPGNWGELTGHYDWQYLVKECNGEYSLWKFAYLLSDETNKRTYSQILSMVYDISDSGDIGQIQVCSTDNGTDTNSANTDDATSSDKVVHNVRKIYKTLKNYDELNYVYYVMSQMSCYGNAQWEKIIEYPTHEYYEIIADSVKLVITTTKGEVLDNFYYSDLAGCFYEFENGIAYSKVSDNAKERLYEIFYEGTAKEKKSYLNVLADHNIYTTDDISSVLIKTIDNGTGETYSSVIRDTTTIQSIFDILSTMKSTGSTNFDYMENVYGAITYELTIFDSNGASTSYLVYDGTHRCFTEGDVIYNTLNDEACRFFNNLGYDNLTEN